jgi:GH25 family lysozyme M1 (1,4-beta-N-acetylmuramidase)
VIRGFDASPAQGNVDFVACKAAGLDFVILEAWIGNDGPASTFPAQVAAAKAAGLEVMAYGFAYPLKPDPAHPGREAEAQAKAIVDYAWKYAPGCLILVDLEWPAPQDWAKWNIDAKWISSWCQEFCAAVTRYSNGKFPVIYTYRDWWDHVAAAADVSWAGAYALWMAWYVKAWPKPGDSPSIRKPWTDWLFWQWDGDGGEKLPNGCDADFCVFNGTLEELQALNVPPAQGPDFGIVHPDVS